MNESVNNRINQLEPLNSFSDGVLYRNLQGQQEVKTTGDVNIIGGSIAGLLGGREIALEGLDVSIYEEHREIGVPEKCDGLVSSAGLEKLGLNLPSSIIQNSLKRATFFSPSMKEISINAERQNVIVIDRSRFDKYLAELAARAGAKIKVGERVSKYGEKISHVSLSTSSGEVTSKILLDCGGYESYISSGGTALQGGQYLVYGKWFEKNTVEVYLDPVLYPGFFKWVIPLSDETAKIGVAGDNINTFQVLDDFARSKGAVVMRKMAAPVLCFGTRKEFVKGRIARAGDSAGQAKPTTGGGIYTGGYGGMLAGRAAARAIKLGKPEAMLEYQEKWNEAFGREFALQTRARSAFSKLKSDQVDRLFSMISASDIPKNISEEGDFDRHSIAIIKAFGLSNVVSIFGMLFINELKEIIGK